MACVKTTSKGMKVTIPDPTETPNAHQQPPIVFLVGAGIQFMLLLVLIFKAVRREKKTVSDLLHILFFIFGSAGYGLYGAATLIMAVEPVGSSKLTTIISRIFMVASWASLLLNCCCLMESIAMPMGRFKMSQNSLRMIFHIFSLLLILAAFVGAAISRDHLLSTLAFLSVISGTCAVSFLRAAYVDHVNKSLAGTNMMKFLGTIFGCVALLVAAILEPICGYAAHDNNCYEGCEVPGFHSLLLVILLLGTWLFVGLAQSCSPDDGAIPSLWSSQTPPEVVQAVAPSQVGAVPEGT